MEVMEMPDNRNAHYI